MTIGEMYTLENKARQRMAKRHKLYRMFGYNPELKAFRAKCAFCLTDLVDESVYGVCEQSSVFDSRQYNYHESHKCSGCGQKWSYFRVGSRGKYSFDAAYEEEMKKMAWVREENSRNIASYAKMMKEDRERKAKENNKKKPL